MLNSSFLINKNRATVNCIMSFEGVLQHILNNLTLTSADRQSYTQDAEVIRDYVIRKMKEKDADFRRWFIGSTLTGSYLDDLKIEKPDEFDVHMKLQVTYKLTVRKVLWPIDNFFLCYEMENIRELGIKEPINHISEYDIICHKKLQTWIRKILESILSDHEQYLLLVNGRTYRIEYSKILSGYAVAHTILAADVNDKNRKISFDFVPAFEFGESDWISRKPFNSSGSQWFAVPYQYNGDMICSFMICAPHLERELLSDKNNLKNSLRLLKAIRDSNEMPYLKSYLMKTAYLWENERQPCDSFWQQPMGTILIHMMETLIQSLDEKVISFFWQSTYNLLYRWNEAEIHDYQLKMQKILEKLKCCRDGSLSLNELRKIFGCV